MALAGLICGFVGLAIVVLAFLGCLALVGFGVSTGAFDEFKEEFEKEMQQQGPMTQPGVLLEPVKVYVVSRLV